jgi:hypothetical protein
MCLPLVNIQIKVWLLVALSIFYSSQITAIPITDKASAPCVLPTWKVDSLSVTYSDQTDVPGTAHFNISSSLGNTTSTFDCQLAFNSLCIVDPITVDGGRSLSIYLQINIDTASVTVNETFACGSDA